MEEGGDAFRVPAALTLAVRLWLITVPVAVASGLGATVSLTMLEFPAVAGLNSTGAALAQSVLVVSTATINVACAVLALAYAPGLRLPGRGARWARRVLGTLTTLVTVGTVIGYLNIGILPFSGRGVWSLTSTALDLLWLAAAITATSCAVTPAARAFAQQQPQ